MKRLILFFLLLCGSLPLLAQAQITTRKYRLSDFQDKTLKVVLSGSEMLDALTREEVMAIWTLSPFEFCTTAEFERLKSSSEYYFLVQVEGRTRGEAEPGVTFLSVLRGGASDINEMEEIINMPLCSAEDPSGREMLFYGALLDIIQDYIEKAMLSEWDAYAGLSNYAYSPSRGRNMRIYMSREDVNPSLTSIETASLFDQDFLLVTEDEADEVWDAAGPGTLVSYVVAATTPRRGSNCYKMLIDPQTHRLYYFRRHKISNKAGRGFLLEDIKKIAKSR